VLTRRLDGVNSERASVRVVARLVGINHVALEVGDVDDALEWYGRFFEFELRGRGGGMAFIDMGDQFIALARDAEPHRDRERHFGLVVDDKASVRRSLEEAGVELTRAPNLSFRDPWGNHVQVVDYAEVQFTKAAFVLVGMGLGDLRKTRAAAAELEAKGLAPGSD
jgi:catechol 2,3-dioxygenase-like lactoylglutathione lyase family enzyme